MYCRQKDYRARLACKLPGRHKDSDYYSRPLNLLEVSRAGPCLQFRERGRRKGDLFMELKFKTIERECLNYIMSFDVHANCLGMILFFCTFLALRSQDRGRPIEDIHDHELKGEVEWFSGYVIFVYIFSRASTDGDSEKYTTTSSSTDYGSYTTLKREQSAYRHRSAKAR